MYVFLLVLTTHPPPSAEVKEKVQLYIYSPLLAFVAFFSRMNLLLAIPVYMNSLFEYILDKMYSKM